MKFALIFLMSALVVVTNQQYLRNYPARSLAWWLPKPPAILNRYQQHYYEQPTIEADVPYFRYAKPMIKNHRPVLVYAQPEDEELLSPTELMDPNAAGPYGDVMADDNQQIFVGGPQSRSKASLQSLLPEKLFPRYFFGTEATIKNPFIKTATYTLSSTLTLSSVVNCIHSTKFVDDTARRRYCARRRRLLELLEKKTANEERQFPNIIAPSEPLQSETTALPFSADLMRDNRQIHQQTSPSWNINIPTSSAILSSSKEEDTDADESQSRVLNLPNFSNPDNNNNKQRFVYIASPYVASTTLTSYSFASTTLTRTVDVAITLGLNCIPVGYVVCA